MKHCVKVLLFLFTSFLILTVDSSSKEDLPEEEQNYVNYVKDFLNNPIQYRFALYVNINPDRPSSSQLTDKCDSVYAVESTIKNEEVYLQKRDEYINCMISNLADIGPSLYLDYFELISEFEDFIAPLKFKKQAEEQKTRNILKLNELYMQIKQFRARARGNKYKKIDSYYYVHWAANLNIDYRGILPLSISEKKLIAENLNKSALIQKDRGIKFEELVPPPTPKPIQVDIVRREGDSVIVWDDPDAGSRVVVFDESIKSKGIYRQAMLAEYGLLTMRIFETDFLATLTQIEVNCNTIPFEYRFIYRRLLYRNKRTFDKLSKREMEWKNIFGYRDTPDGLVVLYICQYGNETAKKETIRPELFIAKKCHDNLNCIRNECDNKYTFKSIREKCYTQVAKQVGIEEYEIENQSPNVNSKSQDVSYINSGYDKYELGKYKEAIEDFNKAIELNPNDAKAYYKRGKSKSGLGDYSGAIQDYDKAIELNPNNPKAYNNRGNSKSDLGDYSGAIQDYDKAIELNPHYVTYYNRGNSKSGLGDYSGAIQDYNKAIELNPNFAEAYNNRGITKDDLSDNRGAIQDYNKAIELNPNDADAYYNRGTTKINLGQKDSGCLDLSKAGEQGNMDAYDSINKYCQ